jgi:hypothetical protein
MAEEPLRSTESPSGSRRRHGARHPAGAEEDWELSSDDERAAGAGAVMTAGGSPLRRARAPVGKRRSLAEIEGYPTWSEDLPALLDLVRGRGRAGNTAPPAACRGECGKGLLGVGVANRALSLSTLCIM